LCSSLGCSLWDTVEDHYNQVWICASTNHDGSTVPSIRGQLQRPNQSQIDASINHGSIISMLELQQETWPGVAVVQPWSLLTQRAIGNWGLVRPRTWCSVASLTWPAFLLPFSCCIAASKNSKRLGQVSLWFSPGVSSNNGRLETGASCVLALGAASRL